MMKVVAALLVAASLGGCVTHDYCAESHPIEYRQRSAEWEASYRTCRMMQAVISQPARPSIDVYIRN